MLRVFSRDEGFQEWILSHVFLHLLRWLYGLSFKICCYVVAVLKSFVILRFVISHINWFSNVKTNHTWAWCIMPCVHGWSLWVKICLERLCVCSWEIWPVAFLFFVISLLPLNQGNIGLIQWTGKYSLLINFLENFMHYIFFKCFG